MLNWLIALFKDKRQRYLTNTPKDLEHLEELFDMGLLTDLDIENFIDRQMLINYNKVDPYLRIRYKINTDTSDIQRIDYEPGLLLIRFKDDDFMIEYDIFSHEPKVTLKSRHIDDTKRDKRFVNILKSYLISKIDVNRVRVRSNLMYGYPYPWTNKDLLEAFKSRLKLINVKHYDEYKLVRVGLDRILLQRETGTSDSTLFEFYEENYDTYIKATADIPVDQFLNGYEQHEIGLIEYLLENYHEV